MFHKSVFKVGSIKTKAAKIPTGLIQNKHANGITTVGNMHSTACSNTFSKTEIVPLDETIAHKTINIYFNQNTQMLDYSVQEEFKQLCSQNHV